VGRRRRGVEAPLDTVLEVCDSFMVIQKVCRIGPNMWITGMLRLGGLDCHDKERIVLGGVTGRRTR
jgi:hypothetical protein